MCSPNIVITQQEYRGQVLTLLANGTWQFEQQAFLSFEQAMDYIRRRFDENGNPRSASPCR